MRTPFLFLLMLSLCCSVSLVASAAPTEKIQNLIEEAKHSKVSEQTQWRRLLHFTSRSPSESEVDGPNFFLAKDGKKNPEHELELTLRYLLADPTFAPEKLQGANSGSSAEANNAEVAAEQSQAVCRYPARNFYLRGLLEKKWKEISGEKWPEGNCPRFQRWFSTLRGPSISLVFSGYYLNSPSSAFGHTFLRINKSLSADRSQRHELLDYGVNYAANVAPNENAIVYAFRGLFGLFPGTFSTMPYYYKVREYNNAESRDLWEYELSLTSAQVDFFIMHLWEIGPTYLDYWYLTENCSYQVLVLLEVADPNLDIGSHLNKYVIPADTVHTATEIPGLVRRFNVRPSIRAELFSRVNLLNDEEQSEVIENYKSQSISEKTLQREPNSQAQVLDTLADYVDYRHQTDVQIKDSKPALFKNKALAARSRLNVITPQLEVKTNALDQPHVAHKSLRAAVGLRGSQEQSWLWLQYRFAYHDQLDPAGGYPDYSEIYFGDLQASVDDTKKKFEFEKFTVVEVVSHSPWMKFSPDMSWRIRIGADRLKWLDCYNCHAPLIAGGPSYTFLLSEEPRLTVNMGVRAFAYTTLSAPGNRIFVSVGPEIRWRMRWTPMQISLLEGSLYRDQNREGAQENKLITLAHQYSFNLSDGLRFYWTDRQWERVGGIDWLHYY